MSDILNAAVTALNEKLGGEGFDSSAKFTLGDEGSIVINEDGASISDDEADCTLTADVETFQGIMSGDINPTSAFMSGKLSVDGDMGIAMKLGQVLA